MGLRWCNLLAATALMCLTLGIKIHAQDKPVSDVCMGCICETVSNCNQTAFCTGGVCGAFHITQAYWRDGGKLTLGNDDSSTEQAFVNCVNDIHCAANTVQNYMTKFEQDCNGDAVIDCYDYASIHKLGGYGCKGDLDIEYFNVLDQCLTTYSKFDKTVNKRV